MKCLGKNCSNEQSNGQKLCSSCRAKANSKYYQKKKLSKELEKNLDLAARYIKKCKELMFEQ